MSVAILFPALYNACVLDALDKTGGLDEGKEVRPFLIWLAENCFHSGIPEEDAVRWTMIYRDLKFFEEEIRETIHTAYLLSRNFGKKFSIPQEQSMAVKTDEFMKRRYEFRRNMLTGDVEFRARGSYYIRFAPVTDTVLNSIGLNAQSEGLALWDRDVKRYVYSDRAPVFHRWMIFWIICRSGTEKIISVLWRIRYRPAIRIGGICFIFGF